MTHLPEPVCSLWHFALAEDLGIFLLAKDPRKQMYAGIVKKTKHSLRVFVTFYLKKYLL